jgi:uncharacterized protein YutE (UPF0331/DUF86 family)
LNHKLNAMVDCYGAIVSRFWRVDPDNIAIGFDQVSEDLEFVASFLLGKDTEDR